MELPREPMTVINNWQKYNKGHKVVAEIDEPLVTKDSRENLHDTSNATELMPDWRTFFEELAEVDIDLKPTDKYELITKATNYFADTIAEFLSELGGARLHECFLNAAKNSLEFATKEYDNNKELVDLLTKKKK